MTRERLLTLPLCCALVGAAGLLAVAAYERFRPRSFDELVKSLREGDCEGDERRSMLRALEAQAVASSGRVAAMAAAMAAIARDDEATNLRFAGTTLGQSPITAADVGNFDVAACDTIALGDDVLRRLLDAWLAEARGQSDAARLQFEQIGRSALLFRMPLAATLCGQGQARLF